MQWDDIVTGASLNMDEDTSEHDAWWNGVPFSQIPLDNDPGYTIVNYNTGTGYINWTVSYLNSEWTWNRICDLDQGNEEADARVISVHEAGHWLVLGHDSNHQEAVMWANYTCKLQTEDDDHDGANYLYP